MYFITEEEFYKNKKILIAMFVENIVNIDSRVIKTVQTLNKLGYSVTVFGFDNVVEKTLRYIYDFSICALPNPTSEMKKMKGWSGSKNIDWKLFTKIGAEYIYEELKSLGINVLHTHDMVGFSIVGKLFEKYKLRKTKWIHDLPEYVEASTNIVDKKRLYFAQEEQKYITKPNILTTVSSSIANILKEKYKLKSTPILALNSPRYSDFDPYFTKDIRLKLGISKDVKIFTYIGDVEKAKGVDILIEAMGIISFGHLIILTNSKNSYLKDIKSRIYDLEIQDRVTFLPNISFNCFTSAISSASVGIYPFRKYDNSNVELPIKLFEYLSVGIPIISSDIKTIQNFINDNDCGMTFKCADANDLAEKIIRVSQRLDDYPDWEKKILDLSKKYTLEFNELKFSNFILSSYEKLFLQNKIKKRTITSKLLKKVKKIPSKTKKLLTYFVKLYKSIRYGGLIRTFNNIFIFIKKKYF